MSQRFRHFVLAAYGSGLRLYPAEFHQRYAKEMQHCAARIFEETTSPFHTAWILARDLAQSLLREHLAMMDLRKVLPQLAILLAITTFVAGTGFLISQQVLRISANDPQIQLAEDGAQRFQSGEDPAHIVPDRSVDIASSLAPFVIVYDDALRPLASSARLDRAIPAPPKGVFDFVRAHQQDRLTWQPRPGVRIAAVMTRSAHGFVVAGRNMREVEAREDMVLHLAAVGWLAANLAIGILWLLAQVLAGSKPAPLQAA